MSYCLSDSVSGTYDEIFWNFLKKYFIFHRNIDNVENSLRSLTQLIKNGEIANWDEVFNDIFYIIQQTILHPLNNAGTIKAGALKAMKELW